MSETLDQALSRVWEQDWRHRRSGSTLRSQASQAVLDLEMRPTWSSLVSAVTIERVQAATKGWYAQGLAPATIQKRLNCLSKLGVNVEGCRKPAPKQLKWYLPEAMVPRVLTFCVTNEYKSLGNLIMWTTRTGLRIEESLRLQWADLGYAITKTPIVYFEEVSVPGTKTGYAQARLPLGEAIGVYMAAVLRSNSPTVYNKPFPWTYEQYQTQWNHVREAFGWKDDPTATLKALRRSAARYLHVDCGMPLHMVQQYLRHESMDTTLEYLRLTGGYGTEEMRRYLK